MEDKRLSNYTVQFVRFCAAARLVAQTLGATAEGWGMACVSTGRTSFQDRYQYQDARVRIDAARLTPALHIEMISPHHNPVISIYDEEQVIRSHGEWRMIEAHILALAAGVIDAGLVTAH